jgi:hypothetical protein
MHFFPALCLGKDHTTNRVLAVKKWYGGTGIRARVKRITTAYANHYTIPPPLATASTPRPFFLVTTGEDQMVALAPCVDALIAQLGER